LLRVAKLPLDTGAAPVVLDHQDAKRREVDAAGIAGLIGEAPLVVTVRSGNDPQQRHQILRPSRQRSRGIEPQHLSLVLRVLPRSGYEPSAGLVAEHAVAESGRTDRSAQIGADAERRGSRADDGALAARAPARDPVRIVPSACLASTRVCSKRSRTIALIRGFTRVIRSMCCSTTSVDETSPSRMRQPSSMPES
jgi:hypothetical protein